MPRPPILPPIDLAEAWNSGRTWIDWLSIAESEENAEKMRVASTVSTVPPQTRGFLGALPRPVHVLAFAEDWCGDVQRYVPVLERLAAHAPMLRVRYVTREDQPEIFKRYLTNGGEAVPKFVFLNEEFVEWRSGGIDVRMLRLSDFRTAETGLASGAAAVPSTTGDRYYYGGSSAAHWLFFAHYALMPPLRIAPLQGAGPALSRPASLPVFQPAPYQPVRRATIFSKARTATSSSLPTGVGKIRPTGFGRTSVRMSSDGRVTGTAFGRSGSFGRGGSGFSG